MCSERVEMTCEFSWQAQGLVRLRVVVEVNVAVTSGLACDRVSGCCLEQLESRNCLAGLLDVCVCSVQPSR